MFMSALNFLGYDSSAYTLNVFKEKNNSLTKPIGGIVVNWILFSFGYLTSMGFTSPTIAFAKTFYFGYLINRVCSFFRNLEIMKNFRHFPMFNLDSSCLVISLIILSSEYDSIYRFHFNKPQRCGDHHIAFNNLFAVIVALFVHFIQEFM